MENVLYEIEHVADDVNIDSDVDDDGNVDENDDDDGDDGDGGVQDDGDDDGDDGDGDDDDDEEEEVDGEEKQDDDFEEDGVQAKDRSQDREAHFAQACAGRNAHGHFTRIFLYGNLHGKCQTIIPRPAFCAGLRNRDEHGHFRRAILWKFTGKMRKTNPAVSILCEAARPKCTWAFQEPFCVKICRTNAGCPGYHRALTLAVRTPQCGHAVWGTMLHICLALW